MLAEAGMMAEAKAQLDQALATVQQEGDAIAVLMARCAIAASSAKVGAAIGTPPLIQRGLSMADQLPQASLRAHALADVLAYLCESGEIDLARAIMQRLLTITRNLECRDYMLTLEMIARALTMQPDFKVDLITLLNDALMRLKSDEASIGELGGIYAQAARDLSDLPLLEKALEIARRLKAGEAQTIYQSAAATYAAAGQLDEARRYLAMEREQVDQIEMDFSRKWAQLSLVQSSARVGVVAGEEQIIEEARRMIGSCDDPKNATMHLVEGLIDGALIRNDPRFVAQAEEVLQQSNDVDDQMRRVLDRTTVLCRSGRVEEAQSSVNRLIAKADTIADPNARSGAYRMLAASVLQIERAKWASDRSTTTLPHGHTDNAEGAMSPEAERIH